MKQLVYKYNNQEIYEYTIKNDWIELSTLNFGATISAIKVADKNGKVANVVASFDDIQSYFTCPDPYLNAMVGPTAGRIGYGTYELNQETYTLSINNGLHHLHGGHTTIAKQIFDVSEIEEATCKILRFTLRTSHQEDGYPGVYTYCIDYILDKNTLTIQSTCTPSQTSLCNLTSHVYFNLSGDLENSIKQHTLKIPATKKVAIHEDGHPYKIVDIKQGSAFDFSATHVMEDNFSKGDDEFKITRGYDAAYLLDTTATIELADPMSGRKVSIDTDQKSVVVYSANYFDETLRLNHGRRGYPLSAIALETQAIPNAVQIAKADIQLYDENHPYKQCTRYTFTNKESI